MAHPITWHHYFVATSSPPFTEVPRESWKSPEGCTTCSQPRHSPATPPTLTQHSGIQSCSHIDCPSPWQTPTPTSRTHRAWPSSEPSWHRPSHELGCRRARSYFIFSGVSPTLELGGDSGCWQRHKAFWEAYPSQFHTLGTLWAESETGLEFPHCCFWGPCRW